MVHNQSDEENPLGTVEHDRHQRVLRLVCQARSPSPGTEKTGTPGQDDSRSFRSDNLGGRFEVTVSGTQSIQPSNEAATAAG